MGKKTTPDNSVCRNRKASYRFELIEQLECGIVLRGTEVKSLRERQASLDEAYALMEKGELWLVGFHITPYRHGPAKQPAAVRPRKLLVHAQELRKLKTRVEQKGMTLVPLRVYFNERGIAKVTIAVARGKAQRDKRQDLKAREHRREMDRATRRRR